MLILRPFLPALVAVVVTVSASAQTLDVTNNQPFDIRMPITLRSVKLAGAPSAIAQPAGDSLVVLVNAPASKSQQMTLSEGANAAAQDDAATRVKLKPEADRVALSVGGRAMGRLSWSVIVRPATEPLKPKKGEFPPTTKTDFAASHKPLALQFTRSAEGPVFETWTATTVASGLKLDVELRAFRAGFLDVTATATNQSAPTTKVYAAVVTRWEQPKVAGRSLCYDNRRQDLNDDAFSPFRAGDGRQHYIQRGVDWINTRFQDGTGAVWMNDFSPSFTVHREATAKTPARWVGANTAQLAQEAQAKDGAIYSITELARPNIPQYESRLADNVLPGNDQPLTFTFRLAFDAKAVDDDATDNRFVGYAGYNPQEVTASGAKVTFGVPFTRMGTNYFPYSTLGENFGNLRMEGMSKEGYWPLAPQTVNQWPLFADDIRRDLRILKSMGYELVRLHHLEVLYDKDKSGALLIPAEKRWEYLDFFFKELEHLQLKALLDVKLTPEEVAELVRRYGKHVDGVEYDNEILIFQIFDEDVPTWKAVYDAVKKVAPDMPFHLTAHTNSGAFDRLEKLGVKFDRVGQHGYMDGVEPIPSARGYSLAMANYAAEHDKQPLITEWNWRFLMRMPIDERAKVYPPIFENILAARCMPIIYQFQFQDSLAMNPSTLKGIRRYEQLLLSRRPKPEALEMVKLIRKYGDPNAASNVLETNYQAVDLSSDQAVIKVSVTNRSSADQTFTATAEGPEGLATSLGGDAEWTLKPGETATAQLQVSLKDGAKALPGFYHTFVRFTREDGSCSYAWVEVRKPGQPTIDHAPGDGAVRYASGAMNFNFDRPLTIVYPDDASVLELEAAWTVFITLESATGRPAEIYSSSDLAKCGGEAQRTIVLVTRKPNGKASIHAQSPNKLVIAGSDEKQVAAAAMDLVVRYWKNAKDAGARKVGLVAAPAGEAGGKTDLD